MRSLSHSCLCLHWTRFELLKCRDVLRSGVFYPGTGGADEVGYLEGQGYSVNVPWPHGGMGNGAHARCMR